jgi:hypothetical protein
VAPRCGLEELERDAHGPDEDNDEDHAYEDADDDCDYPLPVHPPSETEWTGPTPHTADETPRVHAPSVFSTKPDPVRCPLSHHDARLNMPAPLVRGLAVMALAAEWVRRALRPVLIRLSNPSFAADLCAHFRNSGFTAKRRGSRTIEVGRADAPTPEQEEREINLHLRVWRATNPSVIALIDR